MGERRPETQSDMNSPPTAETNIAPLAPVLTPDQLEGLQKFDTCSLANAIEKLDVRLRNEGYTGPGLRCMTGEFPTMLGYAVTSRVRSANPPTTGHRYYDRTDWWTKLDTYPSPRIAVIQDIDPTPGSGAVAGEIHSAILRALKCVALVTNGTVRDLPAVRRMGFPLFACHVSVSHAYVHIVDFGGPVEICGLKIQPGDLLCADCHGVLSIPPELAAQLPEVATKLASHERKVIDLCNSPEFSLSRLRTEVQELD